MKKLSLSRRSFLRYLGGGVAGGVLLHDLGPLFAIAPGDRSRILAWEPVPYPVPLPGDVGGADHDAARLARFTVVDDLVVPPGFRYEVIAQWGERFGPADVPDRQITFGYNADYVALLPTERAEEFFLFVNHEYISATPWLQGYQEVRGLALHQDGQIGDFPLAGGPLDPAEVPPARLEEATGVRTLCRAALADLGVSILRVRRRPEGGYAVVRDASDHRRIHGWGRQNVAAETPLRMTGPVAGMGIQAVGTIANCSGGVTPWGTALTCEENYQDQTSEYLTPSGRVLPGSEPVFEGAPSLSAAGLPFEFSGLCSGLTLRPDPRSFGWVCEVDPATGAMWKHTALGRFRHENVAPRTEPGRPLAAYMGDDRRGGHVWKYVSRDPLGDPGDKANRRLFEAGTLYVARFEPDYTGRWIPLSPDTPLRIPEPSFCATGFLWLPARPTGGWTAVGTYPGGQAVSPQSWMEAVAAYAGAPFDQLTLGDLVAAAATDPQAVLLLDAFVMANAAGGTPCARPEDLEVHPHDHSVYIAFTDSNGSGDGAPDTRIFPDSRGANSRQYGAIYRLVEDGNDPAARTFTWGRFVSSGECADGGGGFACADNLAFDPDGNLWMVTDISTTVHNFPVNRDEGSAPGTARFPGVFGNNAMFIIPTAGPDAGVPRCFATGPMECEMTGPWYTEDDCVLLSIQHPGEVTGTRNYPGLAQPSEIRDREIPIAGRDGQLFVQQRTVPLGSNFPALRPGAVPRPCVVCMRQLQ